ncbi:hypothetical protein [Paraburkholderia gardini]|uniref:hypothetical protein n=1 Tax=Paraburkholderia gardini TaxID=2823469 RepID=UPI001D275AEF|nr:hypothetical protein [Paraburkholderia gardini]CAG4914184.1 Chromosome partition protein Smc [Paraburkholderia gardini]
MTSKKEKTALIPLSSDDFDPTRLEVTDDLEDQGDPALPPAFAHIPSNDEIKVATHQIFGTELPESLLRTIASESEEVAHSTRKILQEHMRIGGNFANIMAHVQRQYMSAQGDTTAVRNRAAQLVYDYVNRVFRRSRKTVRLYIRIYERFSNDAGAVQMLSFSDLSLLVGHGITQDVVDMVIDAKTENPELSKRQVQALIQNLQRAGDQIAEKESQIELVTNELSHVVGQLDEAQLENKQLAEEAGRLRQQIARDKESVQSTLVELSSVNKAVSVLHQEIATREKELEAKTRELNEAAARVTTRDVEVPTLPAPYKNLAEAMQRERAALQETTSQLEQKQAELAAIEQSVAEKNAKIEASEVLEKKVSGLVQMFGTFVQEYHSAQLLATADGLPARFVSLFRALADLVGKFHVELLAATHTA